MLKTGLKFVFAVSLIFWLVGCGDSIETQIREQTFQKEIDICIDKGGVPIRKTLNNRRLGDCVFPPLGN